jgi:hypothetical protein
MANAPRPKFWVVYEVDTTDKLHTLIGICSGRQSAVQNILDRFGSYYASGVDIHIDQRTGVVTMSLQGYRYYYRAEPKFTDQFWESDR